MNIQAVVSDFVRKIESIVTDAVESRVREVLAGVLGRRGPGRPPKSAPGLLPRRAPGRPRKDAAPAAAKPARKKPVSAKVARQRKIQGEYLGTIRHLSAGARAKVKALAKKDGVAAGLALARKMKK